MTDTGYSYSARLDRVDGSFDFLLQFVPRRCGLPEIVGIGSGRPADREDFVKARLSQGLDDDRLVGVEFVSVALDDGWIEPQFASHPPLDVGTREGPDALRDLLTERLFREFQKEPRFRRFIHHAEGTGPHPHKREVSNHARVRRCPSRIWEPGFRTRVGRRAHSLSNAPRFRG